MKVIYRAFDGREFESAGACNVYEAALESRAAAERKAAEDKHAKAAREDFEFMALCHAKGNLAMYELLKDRSLGSNKS